MPPPSDDRPALIGIAGPCLGRRLVLTEGRLTRIEMRRGAGSAGHLVFRNEGGAWVFANESSLPAQVNGEERGRAVLADGDRIQVAAMVFQASIPPPGSGSYARDQDAIPAISEADDAETAAYEAGEPPFPPQPPTIAPTADPTRSSRRITSSRDAVILDQPEDPRRSKPRLLARMGRALKGEKRQRLDELEAERDLLLRAAGRAGLEGLGGFGLPPGALQRLCSGEPVTLVQSDLDSQALARFRSWRDRLAAFDIEINAVRRDLGLPGGADRIAMPDRLPTELHADRERAFAASDVVPTEELADDEQPGDTDDPETEDRPRTSGRRRRHRPRR